MHTIDTIPGRTVAIEGREFLYFSGTSYLGMGRNEAFRALIEEGLRRYGNNYSCSRISNLQLKIFDEAETYLAAQFGVEAALTLSSGYMAGQIVIQMLAQEQIDNFIYAPQTHPALWRSPKDALTENDDDWMVHLPQKIQALAPAKVAILCNALDPLYAKKCTFDWVKGLPADAEIILVIDDSHGLGITGKEGRGVLSEIEVPENISLIVVSSLGKALGVPGGVVLAKRAVIERLKTSAFFGGGSPASPTGLYALLKAETIYKEARNKLIENIGLFTGKINKTEQFSFLPDYPVFYTTDQHLADKLLNNNILISCFRYPTADAARITRIILSSLHREADIEKLAAAINDNRVGVKERL